jgi:1-acyl-sn-glycerol-3-phosphate acyltransferase
MAPTQLFTVLRRLVTIPVAVVALPLLVITSPLWVPLAVAVDLAQGLFRLPSLRLAAMAVVYLAHEWICLALAIGLHVAGIGRSASPATAAQLEPWRQVEGWWVSSLVRWGGRLLGVHFDLPDLAELPQEGYILLSRHASMADAVLPVYLVAGRQQRFIHYVMKRELRFDPVLDIYGRRLANYFITRGAGGDSEAAAIGGMARAALPRSVLVIFPEGTYASPQRRERVRRSLVRRGDADLVALADELHHLLPPKPAGTLAMLAGQPNFEVVVLGHAGLEGLSSLKTLRRQLPLPRPVTIRWWRYPQSDLPTGDEARIAWLNDRWRSLDRWVASRLGAEATADHHQETHYEPPATR